MKKTLLIVALLFVGNSIVKAQNTFLSTNEPNVGDQRTMFMCDSNVTNYATITGSNAVWDYSTISKINGQTRDISIIDPATSAFTADFPTANKAIAIQGFTTTFLETNSTSRNSIGFVFEEPTFGTVKSVYNDDNALIMNYPFALNDEINDAFEGTLSFEFSGMPMNPDAIGAKYSKYDGYGTIKLNSTTTLNDITRFHTIDTVNATIDFIGMDVQVIIDQYEYYDLANNTLPVFTHTKGIIIQAGAEEPLMEFNVVLSSVEPDNALSTAKVDAVQFNVYPNPVNDQLTVTGNFGEGSIQIVDQTGKIVRSMDSVVANSTISTTGIDAGIYFVKVTANGQSNVQKIVKK